MHGVEGKREREKKDYRVLVRNVTRMRPIERCRHR
jgi:hypothetical protein